MSEESPSEPNDCIDCEACIPECPVEAIFPESTVPAKWTDHIALNAERAVALKASGEGNIVEKQEAKEGPGCKRRA